MQCRSWTTLKRGLDRHPLCRRPRCRFVPRALLKTAPDADVAWRQSVDEVIVTLSVGKHVTKKLIDFVVHPKRLELRIDGKAQLSGSLADAGEVDIDGSYWYMDDEYETEDAKCLTIVLLKKVMGYESFPHLLETDLLDSTITHRVYMSIEIDGEEAGVLIFGLFGRAAPEAVDNFVSLANGRGTQDNREEMTEAVFKHIYPSQYVEFGLPESRQRVDTVSRDLLRREKQGLRHENMGLLSIDPDGSLVDFTLTLNALPQFDQQRVVFGKISDGIELLARIEAQGDDVTGKSKSSVVITGSGEVGESEAEAIMAEDQKRRMLATD